jgi:hypothetical protein
MVSSVLRNLETTASRSTISDVDKLSFFNNIPPVWLADVRMERNVRELENLVSLGTVGPCPAVNLGMSVHDTPQDAVGVFLYLDASHGVRSGRKHEGQEIEDVDGLKQSLQYEHIILRRGDKPMIVLTLKGKLSDEVLAVLFPVIS